MATETILFSILSALFGGGGILAWVKLRPERDLLVGQSAKMLTEAATSLVEPLRGENAKLRDRIKEIEVEVRHLREGLDARDAHIGQLERENTELRERVSTLEGAMRAAGMSPPL